MKILILGGTGAMGSHLVNILSKTSNQVDVTTRRSRKDYKNVHYVIGNAHEHVFIRSLLKHGYDVIVDFMAYSTLEFSSIYSDYLTSCKQYFFLSSSRAYASSERPLTEDSPLLVNTCQDTNFLATDEYALFKGREEKILRESGTCNWTIIRPYLTYSETRLQLGVFERDTWLYRVVHGRSIVFSKDIAEKFTTLTYGYDVAISIARLIGEKKALGQAYHITVNNPIKWYDVLAIYVDEIEKYYGKKPKFIMQDKCINLKSDTRKWKVIYDRLYNRVFDNKKIRNFVDTDKFITPQEGLRKCIRDFLAHPSFGKINWKEQAQLDSISKEIASPREFHTLKHAIKYYIYRFVLS